MTDLIRRIISALCMPISVVVGFLVFWLLDSHKVHDADLFGVFSGLGTMLGIMFRL